MYVNTHEVNKLILADKKVKSGLRAEEVREQLDPKSIIQSLLQLAEDADTADIEDLPKLKFKAEIYTTVLKKCMPDLRSLEIKENNSKYKKLVIEMGTIVPDQ